MNIFVSGIGIDGIPVWDTVTAQSDEEAVRIAETEMDLDCVQTHKSSFGADARVDKLLKQLFGKTRKANQSPKNENRKTEVA